MIFLILYSYNAFKDLEGSSKNIDCLLLPIPEYKFIEK